MSTSSFIFAILPGILMICIISSLFWVVIYARGKWTFSSGITVFQYLQQYRWFHFGNISLLSLSVILTTRVYDTEYPLQVYICIYIPPVMILTSLLTILTIKEATRTYKTYKSNRLTPVFIIAYVGLGYLFCFTTGIYELSSTRFNPVVSEMLMSFLSRLSIMLPVTLAEIAVIYLLLLALHFPDGVSARGLSVTRYLRHNDWFYYINTGNAVLALILSTWIYHSSISLTAALFTGALSIFFNTTIPASLSVIEHTPSDTDSKKWDTLKTSPATVLYCSGIGYVIGFIVNPSTAIG
ncbi:TPA: hypothetical protein ACRUNN_004226 [Escherichia coli]|uniref:hypothetical protein n=1 Tax=Escherichia coli TaxID=562 RepID=UPI0017558A43|nr:hypothetical protein [Escherichia coli]EEV3471380.1 hypothetical protein [Escherichia coli]EFC9619052.1 hypothetical protein [Escherichia coli]EHL0084842.1 hypothetical protein [Escherichia coli]EHL1428244.1 hypothetical protein [Escherichia coli]HAI4331744.1 hypothetical protein [Escherichia coli]